MKDLLVQIVKALVDYPEKVSVKEIAGEKAMVLELKVADTDRGKIIGKQGRIIRAIRTIVGCASAKLNKKVVIEIVE